MFLELNGFLGTEEVARLQEIAAQTRFVDGRVVEPFATELTVTSGEIAPADGGALQATLDVALVDYTGGLAEGRLIGGDNPILMTMELVLEVLA